METSTEIASSSSLVVLIVSATGVGVGAQVLGRFLKIPSIVLLLLFGVVLGPSVLGLIQPETLGQEGLEALISLAVVIILFEGGLSLDLRSLTKLTTSLRRLVTYGAAIALVGGSLAAHYLGGFPWQLSFLYASLVVVTGPTVIAPLLRQVRVDRQMTTLLEGEGVIIDPVGALIAVLVLTAILETPNPATLAGNFVTRILIGVSLGASTARILSWFLKRASYLDENLKSLVVFAMVWALFAFSQFIQDESGLTAVVVAGIMLTALEVPAQRSLKRFQGQLTTLSVSVLFILLAADLQLDTLLSLGAGSVLTVLALMLIVRPLNIWICTWGSEFNWRQKLFISWIGPKGIVSASVASISAIALTERDIPGGDTVKALVFLTIVMTVVIQGLSAQWVANALQVGAADTKGAVIVGSNPLVRLLGRLLQERDEPVVLIDTKAEEVKAAQQENFTVFFKNAMNPSVLEEAGLDEMGTFLAMTKNEEVNYVLAQRAAEEFSPPRVLAAHTPEDSDDRDASQDVKQALATTLDLEAWNQAIKDDGVKLYEVTFEPDGFSYQQTYLQALIDTGEAIPLLLERQDRFQVAVARQPWDPSDRLFFLFYASTPLPNPEPSDAGGFLTPGNRLTSEKIPTFKELSIPSADNQKPG